MPKEDGAAAETSPANMLAKLQLAALVQVSSLDGSLKYLTRLVGVDSNKVLITALPTPKQMKKETVDVVYDNLFFPEKKLVMRLIAQGSIFAFESEVIAVNYSGSKLLLSSFPTSIQSQALRRDARLPCALSCSCQYQGQAFTAVIVDISQGGCQLHFDPSQLSTSMADIKDQHIQLRLRFYPEDAQHELTVKVIAYTKTSSTQASLGIAFIQAEASVQNYLDSLQLGDMSTMFL